YTVSSIPFPPGTTPTSRTYQTIPGDIAGEDYTALLMGEVSGNWTNTGARPASSGQLPTTADGPARGISVDLPHITAERGDGITIPVLVDGVAISGTASRGLIAVSNPREPGLLRVAVYGAMPMDENGVLLNLKFTA